MIDPSIPLMAKGIDGLQMLDDGNKLAQLWQGQKTDAEMNRIYKVAGGDQGKMMQLGQQSALARLVMPQLQAQQAAQQKALMDQQKAQAEIEKTVAETGKIGGETKEIGLKTGITQNNHNSTIWANITSGGPDAGKFALANQLKAGVIDQDTYGNYISQIDSFEKNPAGLVNYAANMYKASQDPKYTLATVDNTADNATSEANNVRDNTTSATNSERTYRASVYGTDKQYESDQHKIEVDKQKAYFEQNKPLDFQVGNDGYTYAIYPNGKGFRVAGNDGQPIKVQSQKPMSATTQKELFEVDDSIAAGSNAITNLRDALKYSANAYDGVGAIQRAKTMGHVSNDEAARNTVLLDNIVSGNALEMLKATFGGAPTEGERKILLDLQGSANLPSDQREAIYTRAIAAAERRLAMNEKKAQGLRDGSYFKPSQLQQSQVPSNSAGGKRPPVASFFQ